MTPSQNQPVSPYLENALRALDLEMEQLDKEEAEQKLAAAAAAKQREINRQNASKSTGPRTEAGKATSSRNRLAHGLCSSSLIIRGETQEEFDELQIQTHVAFDPKTEEETLLVDQLVEALWRLNRARSVESRTFENMMDCTDHHFSRGGAIETDQSTGGLLSNALSDADHQKTMTIVQRYVTAAERTYRQCLKAVQEAVKRRPAPALAVKIAVPNPKPKAAAAGQTFSCESGFESQFAPNRPESAPAYTDRC
ncbi:MAG: hypothetical protein INH40_21170 [Acidobacteriaceae bacterium]|nr:hypothetical protein [Acidobacteriaceae bacterium]